MKHLEHSARGALAEALSEKRKWNKQRGTNDVSSPPSPILNMTRAQAPFSLHPLHSLLLFRLDIYTFFGSTTNASLKIFQGSLVYTSRLSLSSCLLATFSLPTQACALMPRNPLSSSSSLSHSAWPSTPAAFSIQCLIAGRLAFSPPSQSVLTNWHLTRLWTVCHVYSLGVYILTTITGVCPQATGSTFTSLISCVKQGCVDHANPLTLTAPLKTWQNACNTAGYPLSARAVQSAQDAEQSILSTYTGRIALSPTDPTASSGSYLTSTVSVESRSTTITGTVSPSSITAETGTSTASSSSSSSTHHADAADAADGSPLDVTNQANKQRARSLLGLTICLLAGVAWFWESIRIHTGVVWNDYDTHVGISAELGSESIGYEPHTSNHREMSGHTSSRQKSRDLKNGLCPFCIFMVFT